MTKRVDDMPKWKQGVGPRSVPVVLQSETSECGLAALAMIFQAHGREVSLQVLRRRYRVSRDGASLYQLIQIASDHGFTGRPLQLDLGHMRELRTPCILFWNKMHFVVLEKQSSRGITIVDPGVGRRRYTWMEAAHLFSNVALELTPTHAPQVAISGPRRHDPFSFTGLVRSNPWMLSVLLPMAALSIVVHLGSIAVPKLFSLAIDEVIGQNDEELLGLLLYIFGAVFALKCGAHWLRTWMNERVRVAINCDVSAGVMAHLLRLPLVFFERRSASDVLRRLQALDRTHVQVTAGRVDMAIDAVFAVAFACLMAFIEPRLAFFSIALCALFAAYRLHSGRALERDQLTSIEAETARNGTLLSVMTATETMKLYGYEPARSANWSTQQAAAETAKSRVTRRQEMGSVFHTALSHGHALMVTGLGSVAVLAGEVTVGSLLAFVFYKDLLLDAMQRVLNSHLMLRLVRADIARISDIVDEKPEVIADENSYTAMTDGVRDRIHSVCAEGVTFAYGSFEQPVFRDVHLRVEAGDRVALLGASGSGKSTLLKLLCGFYVPDEGQLTINGQSVTNFGIGRYRRRVAYVAHDQEIVHGTVADNVALVEADFDVARLRKAVADAGFLEEVLQLGAGFNTLLGPVGVKLSSGQRQRLLLARALYRDPDVIFLDEPTSHLDPASRDRVIETLQRLPVACVLATHDDALLRACNRAYRVSEGRLVPLASGMTIAPELDGVHG